MIPGKDSQMPKFRAADGTEVDAVKWDGDLRPGGKWRDEWLEKAHADGKLFYKGKSLWCSHKGGSKVPLGFYVVNDGGRVYPMKAGRLESRYVQVADDFKPRSAV